MSISSWCDRVVNLFYNKLLQTYILDDRALRVWEGVRAYSEQNPCYFRTDEEKCLWLLDELVELYRLRGEEIDTLYGLYQQAKVESWERPPNG